MKKWVIQKQISHVNEGKVDEIISHLLTNRGLQTEKEQDEFLHPPEPDKLTSEQVGIDPKALLKAVKRIQKAIDNKESIIVYADYDADGITAGTVLWETLHGLGALVMPYIPDRFTEGYGLSELGIDTVKEKHNAQLIITVDQGITAHEKVSYAKKKGIDVIVTDHHAKPKKLPDCIILHTTQLSGSGVSWFLSKTLLEKQNTLKISKDLAGVASIGTIADLVPLIGPNRSLVKHGMELLKKTHRFGFVELIKESGLTQKDLVPYHISHILAPRLNAMGRLDHALDALRLLCTTSGARARELAARLGQTNKQRQQVTVDSTLLAKQIVIKKDIHIKQKLLFISDEQFNQGIIGLVAGRLVEEFYLPAVVLSKGEIVTKASARSIAGFNIIEAIRECQDLLLELGGHPMAAGFSVETKKLVLLQEKLEDIARQKVTEDMRIRQLIIDMEVPFSVISEHLWEQIQLFQPFGIGNPEPFFTSKNVSLWDLRKIGKEGNHLKFSVSQNGSELFDAVAFNMADKLPALLHKKTADIAYTIDMNEWNGRRKLQLKVKDIV